MDWLYEHRTYADFGVSNVHMVNAAYRKNLPSVENDEGRQDVQKI